MIAATLLENRKVCICESYTMFNIRSFDGHLWMFQPRLNTYNVAQLNREDGQVFINLQQQYTKKSGTAIKVKIQSSTNLFSVFQKLPPQ